VAVFTKTGLTVTKPSSKDDADASALGKRGGQLSRGATPTKLSKQEALLLSQASALLGRRGGLASAGKTSEIKKQTARENGKRGGRPRKASVANEPKPETSKSRSKKA
jgi:general stress protein YciG